MMDKESPAHATRGPTSTVGESVFNPVGIEGGSQLAYSFDEIDEAVLPRVGTKAANLVKLHRAGLPVPKGYCVPDDVHGYYLEHGQLPVDLEDQLTRARGLLGGKVAVRSSANCE